MRIELDPILSKADKYVVVFLLGCVTVSFLPFATLIYYEWNYPFMLIIELLTIPFSIISIVFASLFWFKLWIPELQKQNKKMNRYLGILICSMIIYIGLIFATTNAAVFYNAFIGHQNKENNSYKCL